MQFVDVANLMQEKDYGKKDKGSDGSRGDNFTHWVILFAGTLPIIFLTNALMYMFLNIELQNDMVRYEQMRVENTKKVFDDAVLKAKVDLIKENTKLSQRIDELEQRIIFLEYAVTSPEFEVAPMDHPATLKM